jgi:hypothetical protein
MNHQLWRAAGARVLALMFVVAAAAACGERNTNTSSRTENPPSPSAVVIGQAPAEPTTASSNTPQTTSPAGAQGTVSKLDESVARPKEGDNHSHSTLAPTTPQKADGVNHAESPERKAQ